ncbi:hypothetical protein PG291_01235 [Riemerella anatipestifer]|nr:hypothetical protein [Riemerella anatipestifer]
MKYSHQVLLSVLIYCIVGVFCVIGQAFLFQYPLVLHFLIAFLHLLGLVTVGVVGLFKKEVMGLVYMAFMLLKMGAFLYLFYTIPELKEQLMCSVGIYFFYLLIETGLIISLISKNIKNQQKS